MLHAVIVRHKGQYSERNGSKHHRRALHSTFRIADWPYSLDRMRDGTKQHQNLSSRSSCIFTISNRSVVSAVAIKPENGRPCLSRTKVAERVPARRNAANVTTVTGYTQILSSSQRTHQYSTNIMYVHTYIERYTSFRKKI